MPRISLTAGAVAMCLALPAFAEDSISGSPANTSGSVPSNDTSAMTCDQIMAEVKSLSISGSGARMAMKQNEMVAARAARARNNEAECKMHATKALQLMM